MSSGKGISASIDGITYLFGNESFIKESSLKVDDKAASILDRFRSEGKASVIAADMNGIIDIIALSDVLRPEAADMIRRLSEMGTRSVLLTGDNKKAAEYFAGKVGITEVRADLLPEQKVENINSLRTEGNVCMIGDGVNDAPALKTADVGVARGQWEAILLLKQLT